MNKLIYILVLLFSSTIVPSMASAEHLLEYSLSPDRSNAELLEGSVLSDTTAVYIFASPDQPLTQVRFSIDGQLVQVENNAPYDFSGTVSNGEGIAFDLSSLNAGTHVVSTLATVASGGTETASATFTVSSDAGTTPVASFTVDCTDSTCTFDASASSDDGNIVSYAWDFGDGATDSGISTSHTYTIDGVYTVSLLVTDDANESDSVTDSLIVPAANYSLLLSANSSRIPAVSLEGSEVIGDIFVFVEPEDGVSRVEFFIDDPLMSGAPTQVEGRGPYDLAGTNPNDTAKSFDSAQLSDGSHEVTARIILNDGQEVISSALLTVNNSGGNSAPLASFTFDCIDTACSFDASNSSDDDSIVNYAWDFGDGTSGSGVNANHSYIADGTYTVGLLVTDNDSATGSATDTLTVSTNPVPPVASFTIDCVDNACTFDASDSTDDISIASYAWDFGDGVSGSGVNASHSYSADGTYTVNLVVTDNDGATGSASDTLTVGTNPVPPVASFTVDCIDNACTFDASDSTDDISIVSYGWDFGDGVFGSGVSASHSYTANGTYTVSLLVTDNDGASGSATDSLIIGSLPVPPVASFTFECVDSTCTFDATGSTDDSNIVSYAWDFGDGLTGNGVNASHTYTIDGVYTVSLLVTDDDNETSSATDSLSVPVAGYSLLLSTNSSRAPAVSLDGSEVADNIFVFVEPEDGVTKVEFFIDDPLMSGAPVKVEGRAPYDLAGTNANDTAVAYDSTQLSEGTHEITARITLSDGGVVTPSAVLTVNNSSGNIPPMANFTIDCVDSTCTFDATDSADDGSIVSYAWEYGDGATGSGVNAGHSYTTDGTYTVTLLVTDNDGATGTISETLSVPAADYSLLLSTDSLRAPAVALDGSEVTGDIFVFVEPEDGVTRVEFFIDDPSMNGAPAKVENSPPFDLQGSNSNGSAIAYDSTQLADGAHEITAKLMLGGGLVAVRTAVFEVNNNGVILSADFSFSCNILSCSFDGQLGDPTGALSNHTWDFGDGSSGTGLSTAHGYAAPNSYTVTHQAEDALGSLLTVSKLVSVTDDSGCPSISTLECGEIRISENLVLDFSSASGGLVDNLGLGTGFTMVDQPSFPGNPQPIPSAPGHWPDQLTLDTSSGILKIDTSAGLQFEGSNSLDNALGVGLNVPSQSVAVQAVITNIPAGPGGFAQGGIWFGAADEFGRGSAEDDYIKLVLVSSSAGAWSVEALMEQSGSKVSSKVVLANPSVSSITLKLEADPIARTVSAFYNSGAGEITVTLFDNVPDSWFSFDQAGIDPTLSTRSFGGIFASHRNLAQSVSFDFDQFSVTEIDDTPVINSDFEFDKWGLPVNSPTATAWGPDGRLYVAELFGTIHAFTLDIPNKQILDEQVISTLKTINGGSNRLTLGLAIDPNSTASNVVLWVGNSDGSLNNGAVNSGRITRISGASLDVGQDIITGLPRAIANHGINNIEFGPDGRLYISAGGSTGSGAANSDPSEFADRPEQPLSAAILVADVNESGFQGSCATPIGSFWHSRHLRCSGLCLGTA